MQEQPREEIARALLSARHLTSTVHATPRPDTARNQVPEPNSGGPSLMSFVVVSLLGEAAASAEVAGRSAAAGQSHSRAVESPIPSPVGVTYCTTLVGWQSGAL